MNRLRIAVSIEPMEPTMRILVAEASPDEPGSMAEILRESADPPMDVISARRIDAALKLSHTVEVHGAVISDDLPGGDGVYFLERLRDGQEVPPMPVIVVFQEPTVGGVVNAFRAGAADVVASSGVAAGNLRRQVLQAISRFRTHRRAGRGSLPGDEVGGWVAEELDDLEQTLRGALRRIDEISQRLEADTSANRDRSE